MFIVFVVLLPDLRIESDKKEGLNTQLMNNGGRGAVERKGRKKGGREKKLKLIKIYKDRDDVKIQ